MLSVLCVYQAYICSLFLKVGGFPQESAVKAPPPTLYILLTFDPSVWSLVADPLPLSYFPLDQCLHSCPPFLTSYPPEALAKPFQCLSSLELRSESCSNVWTHKDTNTHPHTYTHYIHVKVLESLRTAGMDVQHFNCSIYIFVCSGNASKCQLINTCKQKLNTESFLNFSFVTVSTFR